MRKLPNASESTYNKIEVTGGYGDLFEEIPVKVGLPKFYEANFYSFYSRNVEVMNPENELASS